MPRGYLKHSSDVARKAARGGGSHKSACKKGDDALGHRRISRTRRAVTTLPSEDWDSGHDDDTSKSNIPAAQDDQQYKPGCCASCGDFKPLIPLTKKCARHGSCCYECLRDRFVVQAQATGESAYPLQCFNADCCNANSCNRTIIRDVQLIRHKLIQSASEMESHYRFSVIAKKHKGNNCQMAHCPNCNHPRIFQRGRSERVFSCRQCSKTFTVEGDSSLVLSSKMSHLVKDGFIHYDAPRSLGVSLMDRLPVVRSKEAGKLGDCMICFCALSRSEEDGFHFGTGDTDTVVKLGCGHAYHKSCLDYSLKHYKPVCCLCRKPIEEPRGFCPSGKMSLSLMQKTACPGFTNADGSPSDTISITYIVPDGFQMEYHSNPGKGYWGDYRIAYLPHNTDGHELLARLVYAWTRGLIFTVGTSLTRNVSNVLVWTSIHHKTCLNGGAHGFPDPGYLYNCHESLDALYVPTAKACRAAGAGQVIKAFLPSPPKSRSHHSNS